MSGFMERTELILKMVNAGLENVQIADLTGLAITEVDEIMGKYS